MRGSFSIPFDIIFQTYKEPKWSTTFYYYLWIGTWNNMNYQNKTINEYIWYLIFLNGKSSFFLIPFCFKVHHGNKIRHFKKWTKNGSILHFCLNIKIVQCITLQLTKQKCYIQVHHNYGLFWTTIKMVYYCCSLEKNAILILYPWSSDILIAYPSSNDLCELNRVNILTIITLTHLLTIETFENKEIHIHVRNKIQIL